ncbi:MAG: hypothetical protein V3V01_19085 [Acidimicrobiales bacterium]
MTFAIRRAVHDHPGWSPDGTYGNAREQRVWQILEDGIWLADFDTESAARLVVADLDPAQAQPDLLDVSDDGS